MDHPNPTPKRVTVGELASEIGENPMVVAVFIGKLSRTLDVPDWRLLEGMLGLVRELKAERARGGRTSAWDRLLASLSPEERAEAERTGVYDSRRSRRSEAGA